MFIKNVGIVGAGSVGKGIAEVLSRSSLNVLIVEISEDVLQGSLNGIESNLDREVKKWGLTESEKKTILSRIHGTVDISKACNSDIIIIAVPEDMEVKKGVLKKLESICL